MKTEGFVCVDVPLGHLNFLNTYMQLEQMIIAELPEEFQKLISYPHSHDFQPEQLIFSS